MEETCLVSNKRRISTPRLTVILFPAAEIAYNARNSYYFALQQPQIQQSPEGDFSAAMSNNVGSNMYYHGEVGPTFTVWNDT
ncbi:hypothetical protein F2Q70_00005980 [Brassica cretica]|uniref:Uncharacterized protein n=1 Tax=Brassica cretica TaxID=69181 RepID=A0A8S9G080_BRACR|nr:hypothetical protein F2Q68_00022587 [Brassica cretica]KAF2570061.1 hypothetical protein F2Q70_00005980 [Brassica cretica]